MSFSKKYSLLFSISTLLLIWAGIIVFIDPTGEFMVNDDWSFTSIVEALLQGKEVGATGWGEGGPSVFSHIGWGVLFSSIFGYSTTMLRLSVLVLAVIGSSALLLLLHQMGYRPWMAFLVVLVLLFNPLFLSQSFSYMTDITFTSLLLVSLLFLHMGIDRGRQSLFVFGLFFALLAILTRQIGLVIPLALIFTYLLIPTVKPFGKKRAILLTVFITIVPWLCYELFLSLSGSTPVTSHPVVHKIFTFPQNKGFPGYIIFLFTQATTIIMYTAFLVSPLLMLRAYHILKTELMRKIFLILVCLFFFFEMSIIGGVIDPPVGFHQNVLFNFGIGPILLKDIYLLGIQRTVSLPQPIFYLLAFGALLCSIVLLRLLFRSIHQWFTPYRDNQNNSIHFTSAFGLTAALIYSGIIVLTGFHDRYLIPVCCLVIIWLAAQSKTDAPRGALGPLLVSISLLLLFATFSVLGVKDFMTTKRSLSAAHHYILNTLKIDPCDIDGGFEFNGYYCSNKNSRNFDKNLSWWWVEKEKYLVALGPLHGYRVVETFPFSRSIGNDGAIHILKPNDK